MAWLLHPAAHSCRYSVRFRLGLWTNYHVHQLKSAHVSENLFANNLSGPIFFSQDICQSHVVMCPRCHFADCPMELLSNSCYLANVSYVFDNWCAVVYSGIMTLWGECPNCECYQSSEWVNIQRRSSWKSGKERRQFCSCNGTSGRLRTQWPQGKRAFFRQICPIAVYFIIQLSRNATSIGRPKFGIRRM